MAMSIRGIIELTQSCEVWCWLRPLLHSRQAARHIGKRDGMLLKHIRVANAETAETGGNLILSPVLLSCLLLAPRRAFFKDLLDQPFGG